jgi:hypothetical protein
MNHLNAARSLGIKWFEAMRFVFSVGWKASQNTYLFASLHVNGFLSLHK